MYKDFSTSLVMEVKVLYRSCREFYILLRTTFVQNFNDTFICKGCWALFFEKATPVTRCREIVDDIWFTNVRKVKDKMSSIATFGTELL